MYHFIRTCFRGSAIALVVTMMPVGMFITSVQADHPEASPDPPSPALGRESSQPFLEGDRLRQAGDEAFQANDIPAAILLWQQALEIYRHPSVRAAHPQVSRERSGHTLNRLGQGYRSLGEYQDAIAVYEELLEMAREPVNDPLDARRRQGEESNTLSNLGNVYMMFEQYGVAIEFYQQALSITRELMASTSDPVPQQQNGATLLSNIALGYFNLGQYDAAIATYSQAIPILQELGDASRAANVLHSLGAAYLSLGRYEEAIAQYEQALEQARISGNYRVEDAALADLRVIYQELGQEEVAARLDDQQVALGQDRIDVYVQRLLEVQAAGDRRSESILLNNLANIHFALTDYRQALTYYEQRLLVVQELNDQRGEANTYADLGITYRHLGRHEQAIAMYEQAVAIFQDIGDRRGAENALGNLGIVYQALGRYPQAIERYEQQQAIAQQAQDPVGEGLALSRLGIVYQQLGRYEEAIAAYQQSLVIFQSSGSQPETGVLLSNIGRLLALQGHPELAIIFYKQSVNVRESIRGTLQGLPPEWQQSFTETVADDYRALADLLLQQDRVLEAQRVLDLLRVQELDDYLQDVRSTAQTESGIDYWQIETELLALYQQVLNDAAELRQLRFQPFDELTAAEQNRLSELRENSSSVQEQFFVFRDRPEVDAAIRLIRESTQGQNLELDSYAQLQDELQAIPQRTVVLYPLILENRLELVLVFPDAPPLRLPVNVTGTELNQAIVEFGQQLTTRDPNIEAIAQQLYTWLVAPMEDTLTQQGIESIIYSPDGALRYIPLAALHDGEQYLAQRFSISHITADSLTNLAAPPRENQRLLAAACAECSFSFTVADSPYNFSDLPFTAIEVSNLANQYPETSVLLNQDFSLSDLENRLGSYEVIHLATHAAFVTSVPQESFLVLGSGERISLQYIRQRWNLNHVGLIVLSACETAVGSVELGSGIEFLGLGHQLQTAGAQSVIASLWAVSDGGTQTLMDAFYANLNQQMSKAEALRQAQIALITGDLTASGVERGASIDVISTRTGLPANVASSLSHPYYWAPFILIGNGL